MTYDMVGLENNTNDTAEYDILRIVSGTDGPLGKVLSLIHNVSHTDIPVLIVGENGTLKWEFAQEIHRQSKRKNGKLLTVNCSNPDVKSLEIEIFGCENRCQNFTMHKIGKIEQAYGGSIILREIAETPFAIQARLLQVLQEHEIYRVNGHTSIPVDVRIIATTSRLDFNANNGKFRKDLFYRISVFPIIIPPLRRQYALIDFLLDEFLEIASKKFNKNIKGFSKDAMILLRNYDWPGNITELKNVVEHAVKAEKTNKIQVNALPKEVLLRQISEHFIPFIDPQTQEMLSLNEIEKISITNALKITGYNVHKTAKLLGINRATVYRKLEKYNLI